MHDFLNLDTNRNPALSIIAPGCCKILELEPMWFGSTTKSWIQRFSPLGLNFTEIFLFQELCQILVTTILFHYPSFPHSILFLSCLTPSPSLSLCVSMLPFLTFSPHCKSLLQRFLALPVPPSVPPTAQLRAAGVVAGGR